MAVALIGGTGAEGRGLALRFIQAGQPVVIGSREQDRAEATAVELNRQAGGSFASGAANAAAAEAAPIIILTVPYAGMAETAAGLEGATAGKVVVSAVVPLEFGRGGPHAVAIDAGSAAQQLQSMLPQAQVVGAFHHLSAETLADLTQPVGADVLVCGDDTEAKASVIALAELLPEVRGVDAGPLESAHYLETFTALILRINRRYRVHAGLRLTHLFPERRRGD